LRDIAEQTSLGLGIVRTILDQQDGVDRTAIKHLKRIDPERARERVWQAKRQMRQALPRRIAAVEKANAELRKEAKGIK
jgi:cytochrome c556